MRYVKNVTANGDFFIADVVKGNSLQSFGGHVYLKRNAGTGVFTLKVSPDGGTTLYTVLDVNGNEITETISTGNERYYAAFTMPNGNTNTDALKLYATIASASSTDFDIIVYDNR